MTQIYYVDYQTLTRKLAGETNVYTHYEDIMVSREQESLVDTRMESRDRHLLRPQQSEVHEFHVVQVMWRNADTQDDVGEGRHRLENKRILYQMAPRIVCLVRHKFCNEKSNS